MVEQFQLIDRAGGDLLLICAGIHLDPFSIGVAVHQCIEVGQKRRADLGITDDAGRERGVSIEDIALCALFQYVMCMRRGGDRFRYTRERILVEPPRRRSRLPAATFRYRRWR